jgi:HD superfamily phosphodiesterase
MEQTKLEKYLENTLLEKLGNEKGKDYYADYQSARKYLVKNILPNIKATEPELTDHSERHIENVLNNAWHLLDTDKTKLSEYDIYVLCLSILLHDVGNINGRKEHNKKVSEIYNTIRKNDSNFNTERALVLKAVKAHCGTTNTGSRDTLVEVEITGSLRGEPVQLREIASILRFADELAEGPQRTSDYLIDTNKIPDRSKIYHRYAQITNVFIDRGNERIVLQYHIDTENETQESFRKLLSFAYERIIKLDEERRYTKFHSKLLEPFKKTEVTFNFTHKGEPLDLTLDKIVLHDTCVIPGDKQPCITDLICKFSALNIDDIIRQLNIN